MSAKGHWKTQRITAIALVPLIIWFVFSATCLMGATHTEALAWVAQPCNAVLLSLLVISLFSHSQIGVEEIVQDYVYAPHAKAATLVIVKFINIALTAAALFSILRVAL